MQFFLGDKFYGNLIVCIRGQNEVLEVKVIWESNIALGAECLTGHGTFEIGVRIRVNVRLELVLYMRLWLWLELFNTTQNVILKHDY